MDEGVVEVEVKVEVEEEEEKEGGSSVKRVMKVMIEGGGSGKCVS